MNENELKTNLYQLIETIADNEELMRMTATYITNTKENMLNLIHWNPEYITVIANMIQHENHQIVPIIGNDVFYIEENGKKESLQKFIFHKIIDEYIEDDYKKIVLKECTGNDLRRMTKLKRYLKRYGKGNLLGNIPTIYACLAFLLNEEKQIINQIKLDEQVKCFLQYGRFPLIITTCNIEILHKQLIGPMGKNYVPVGYYCQKDPKQDIDLELTKPQIFHLFGICGSGQEPMTTEHDFLKYLHFLHSATSAPENLKKYLQPRTILALGCDMPDWAFRFILHSLSEQGGKLRPKTDMFGGAIKERIEPELKEFLTDINYLSGNNLSSVLDPINNAISRPNLFLSYSAKEGTHEWDGIETIRKRLDPYYNVWFFPERSKKTYGERYWSIIQEGLEKCDVFMPVITKGMIERLQNSTIRDEGPKNDKDDGFLCEWWMMNKIRKPEQRCIAYFLDSEFEELMKHINNPDLKLNFLLGLFCGVSHITDSPESFDPSNIEH